METNKKMDEAVNLQATSQENKNNLIKVEETTSISNQPFSQALANSVESIKAKFKEATTCTADVDNDIAYVEEENDNDALEKTTATAEAIYAKYKANITPAWDLINSPYEPISYVIEKFLPQGELCVIYGDSGCGKSMLARCVLFAVAYGMEEYLGLKIELPPERRKVAIFVTEDSGKSIKTLLQKQSRHFEQYRTIENPVFDVIDDCDIDLYHTLAIRMKEVPYSIVMVDISLDDMEGDGNNNSAVRGYLKNLSKLGSKYNCTMIIVNHITKYTSGGAPSKDNLLGTRAFGDKARVVCELRKNINDKDSVYLTPMKANYEDNTFLDNSYKLIIDKETLTFRFEGETVPSNEIHLSTQKQEEKDTIVEKVSSYKRANPKITQTGIAELLRGDFPGRKINQSQVSNILKSIKDLK